MVPSLIIFSDLRKHRLLCGDTGAGPRPAPSFLQMKVLVLRLKFSFWDFKNTLGLNTKSCFFF